MNEHWVTSHHFPLGVLECKGDKKITVARDDITNIELPQLPGKEDKPKSMSTLLNLAEEKKYGAHAQSEHREIDNRKGHLQDPIVIKEDVTTFSSALRSYRGERKCSREDIE